jgi:hypothetical protein
MQHGRILHTHQCLNYVNSLILWYEIICQYVWKQTLGPVLEADDVHVHIISSKDTEDELTYHKNC